MDHLARLRVPCSILSHAIHLRQWKEPEGCTPWALKSRYFYTMFFQQFRPLFVRSSIDYPIEELDEMPQRCSVLIINL